MSNRNKASISNLFDSHPGKSSIPEGVSLGDVTPFTLKHRETFTAGQNGSDAGYGFRWFTLDLVGNASAGDSNYGQRYSSGLKWGAVSDATPDTATFNQASYYTGATTYKELMDRSLVTSAVLRITNTSKTYDRQGKVTLAYIPDLHTSSRAASDSESHSYYDFGSVYSMGNLDAEDEFYRLAHAKTYSASELNGSQVLTYRPTTIIQKKMTNTVKEIFVDHGSKENLKAVMDDSESVFPSGCFAILASGCATNTFEIDLRIYGYGHPSSTGALILPKQSHGGSFGAGRGGGVHAKVGDPLFFDWHNNVYNTISRGAGARIHVDPRAMPKATALGAANQGWPRVTRQGPLDITPNRSLVRRPIGHSVVTDVLPLQTVRSRQRRRRRGRRGRRSQ